MPAISVTRAAVLGSLNVSDTALGATAVSVKGSSGTLYAILVDNRSNASAVYVKVYNTTTPTVGTTVPRVIVQCPSSRQIKYVWPRGLAFGTAMKAACVSTGGTGGTSPPSASVPVTLVAS